MDKVHTHESLVVRHATKIGIFLITLLVILISGVFWREFDESQKSHNSVNYTYEVRSHIRALLYNMVDAETGQRGYLISGDEGFLDIYHKRITLVERNDPSMLTSEQETSIPEELRTLQRMTASNPMQQENIEAMAAIIKELLAYYEVRIGMKRKNIPFPRSGPYATSHGKMLMDRARAIARLMEAEETYALATRTAHDQTLARKNDHLLAGTLVGFYLLLILALILYQRSRERAQRNLINYTLELEKREEELKMQQEELKASSEEIESSNEELEEKTKALEEQNNRIRLQSHTLEENKRIIEEKMRELEQSSRYKSEFLANMSHELRTPLNSLLILARSLASNEDGNLTEEQVEEARIIHNGGLDLLALINDILDLSKVEAGKINVVAEDVYFRAIAKRMGQLFDPMAKEKNLNFQIQMDESLQETIHSDGQRIEQIIKNLLSNAFKFTEAGAITLDIRRAHPRTPMQRSTLNGAPMVAFVVTDTGIGIDPNKFRDIFEAFQQEDGSTDRHYGGTGLGLTIARKFAHLLGGEIHVESMKGRGSTFTLFLPLAPIESTSIPIAPMTTLHESGASDSNVIPIKTIPKPAMRMFVPDDRKSISAGDKVLLIIEEDRDFAITLIKTAHKHGYKCLAAGDGKNGLLLAVEEPVTAILLNLRLPDMEGMLVLDQLKHSLNTRHIPVHVIAGNTETDTLLSTRKGAIGYLSKSLDKSAIDGIFTRIESILRTEVKKVLVVEDDKNTQAAVQSLLRQKNMEILIAETGKLALEKVQAARFDCLILDLKLPDMSGFEWLALLEKTVPEETQPPVIIYTARELTEEENRQLSRYTGSIVIKGANSSERLLDEVTLFLHSVEAMLSQDQRAMISMQHDPDRALKNRTVLLVDDDMRNTFALSKLLKKHGMNVVIADNGEMALEKMQQERNIELIIIDIMMPVMDGYDAMRAIRKNTAWQTLPIIALTARAMPEEQERCMEAGANDYLIKPVDIERLLTLLRVWLFKQEKCA